MVGTMTNRKACKSNLILVLAALVVLAGVGLGFAEVSEQEKERQIRAKVEALSQQDWEKIWTTARHGDVSAQYLLAAMYENGYGVPKNPKQAANWYRKAAEQGYAPAQSMLGWMYDKGTGVLENYSEAAKWYRLAAFQGHPGAQNNLGRLCLQSGVEGLSRGRKRGSLGCGAVEAYAWMVLAAAQGHEAAAKNKELLSRQAAFADEVVKGQRLARKLLNRSSPHFTPEKGP